jgi:hypothetical protein
MREMLVRCRIKIAHHIMGDEAKKQGPEVELISHHGE